MMHGLCRAFVLLAGLAGAVAHADEGADFDRTLSLQGVSFQVSTRGSGAERTLRIAPHGLTHDNSPIERTIRGRVTGMEVEDLNADGSPEIYIYIATGSADARADLVAYAANRGRSLSEVYLPPIEANAEDARVYAGHDQFTLIERNLLRIYPRFNEGRPSGHIRQIAYHLTAGEAGWVLKRVRVSEI